MSISKDELKPENSNNVSEETIPDEAKPIFDKVESQIESIVKGFNQVFKDNGVPEVTIGDFQYIIQIPSPSKPDGASKPLEASAPDGNIPGLETKPEKKVCREKKNGVWVVVPCPPN